MRVLVTGGAGFIGSHLVDRLLARGDRVVCLDDFDDYYDPALKRANLTAAHTNERFRLVEGDLLDPQTLTAATAQPLDVVVHLAARAGVRPSLDDPRLYYRVNCEGTAALLEACRAADVRRFVFASSSSVYGGNTKVPFHEDDPVEHPVSPYAATKRAGELLCHTYHHLYGFEVVALRFFTVYGPRQRPEMAIHKFTRLIAAGQPIPLFGSLDSSRDYTYVDDIIDGVVRAIERTFERPTGVRPRFRIYNLGESRTVPLGELVELIGRALGVTPHVDRQPAQPGDVAATFADVSRARAELGYDPRVPVEEGLRRFVAWLRPPRG
jgi:UDP-glucuronate 4-epimerase